MELQLYKNNSSFNTINKDLTLLETLEIHLKQSTNLFNTQLIIHNNEQLKELNYVKMLDRCYFVQSYALNNDKFLLLNLNEDVIETFKDNILNSECDIISKSTIDYSSNVPTSKKVDTKIIKSNVTLPDEENIVVQTSGTKNATNIGG